jgi:phosphatidylglycerophosphate synthase
VRAASTSARVGDPEGLSFQRFLAARQQSEQAMPPNRLEASAARTLTLAWIAVGGLALLSRSLFELSGSYPAKAVGAFGVVIFLALRHVSRQHPYDRFGSANQITTARAAIVALFVALIGEHPAAPIAVAVALGSMVATVLDGVDGWAARRFGIASRFGARFDVETDAALIQVLAVLVWGFGKAGPWIIAAGLLRYVFVAAGWLMPWMRAPLPSSLRGRAICVIQIIALVVAMLPSVPPQVSSVIAASGLSALVYSFAVDTLWLWRHSASQRTR